MSQRNTIDECPECLNKPWSPEFLNIQAEIESEAEEEGPELIH